MNPSFTWTRRAGVILSLGIGTFVAFGFIAPAFVHHASGFALAGSLVMALFFGSAQFLANCMSANTRKFNALGLGYRRAFWASTACYILAALVSVGGMQNAWGWVADGVTGSVKIDAHLIILLCWVLPFSDFLIFGVVEALKAADHETEDRYERERVANEDKRRADLLELETTRSKNASSGRLRTAAALLLTAGAAATGAAAIVQHNQGALDFDPQSIMEASASNSILQANFKPKNPELFERFIEGIQSGKPVAQVIRDLNMARSSGYKWNERIKDVPLAETMDA